LTILSIILLGTALSMDACAVSISCGIYCRDTKYRHAFKAAAFFGAFQMLMPLAGYYAGRVVYDYISHIAPWIAFILLALIGAHMIYSAVKCRKKEQEVDRKLSFSFKALLILAVATSIDALAAGVSFALVNVDILMSVALIGSITFLLSFLSVLMGKKVGKLFGWRAEFVGGLILFSIGLKILLGL